MNATVVARVIDAHTPTGSQGDITCWCEERFESWAEHATHVATAVLASMDLTEETGTHPEWVLNDPPEMDDRLVVPTPKQHIEWIPKRRFVSGWQQIGEETKQ